MHPIKDKYQGTKLKYQDTKYKLESRLFPWARKYWLEIILVSIVVVFLLSFGFDLGNLYPFVWAISIVVIAAYVVMQYRLQQTMALESCRFKAMILFIEASHTIDESGDVAKGLPKMKQALVVARNGCDRQSSQFIEAIIDEIEQKKITKANLDVKLGDVYSHFM